MTAACMGGWCMVRERCKHYHVENVVRLRPVERLCEPELHTAFRPVANDAFEQLVRAVIPIREVA